MYKWFVWSSKLQKYLPISGLSATFRGACAPVLVDTFGFGLPPMFSIPMFNRHNSAYFE